MAAVWSALRPFKWREALVLSGIFVFMQGFALTDARVFEMVFFHSVGESPLRGGNFSVLEIVAIKLLLVYIGFFCLHWVVINFVNPPRGAYSGFFLCYSYVFILVYYPQLLSDIPQNRILTLFMPVASSITVKAVGLAFGLALFYWGWTRGKNRPLATLLSLGILAWVFYVNDPYLTFESPPPHHRVFSRGPLPNIIMIGMDGLRPGSLDSFGNDEKHPYLARFLKESRTFSEAISPVARTMPALYSILSGKAPVETGIRGNLQKDLFGEEALFADSALSRLKDRGYQVTVGISDSSYAYFKPGKYIDQVLGPPPGLQNYLLPYYLRDPLLFAWLNNSFGLKLIPEVIGDGGLYDTWWPQIFRNEVLKDLGAMGPGPYFKLYHVIKPHWPGTNQYPYYHVRQASPYADSPYGYTSMYYNFLTMPTCSSVDVDENLEIYREGVRELVDTYLEGVLAYLYESGLTKTSAVALFSDHGEAFYDSRLLPMSKRPKHGAGLLNADDAEQAYFAVRLPEDRLNVTMPTPPFNLRDALPLMEHESGIVPGAFIPSPPTSESDIWASVTVPGEILSWQTPYDDMAIDDHGLPFRRLDQINRLNKQRSVYDAEFRLTLFFTKFGFQLQLEKLHQELGNLAELYPERVARLFVAMRDEFRLDFERGYLPELTINRRRPDPFVLEWSDSPEALLSRFHHDPEKWQWQVYMRSQPLFHYDMNVPDSMMLLHELLIGPGTDPEIKLRANIELFEILVFTGHTSPDTQRALAEAASPSWPTSLRKDWFLMKILALQRLGEKGEALTTLEAAQRDFGPSINVFDEYPTSVGHVFLRQKSYFRIPERLWLTRGWLDSQNNRSDVDQLFWLYEKLQDRGSSARFAPVLKDFSDLLSKQRKYKLYGINDEWYLAIASSEMRWPEKMQALAPMLDEPFTAIETLSLIERILVAAKGPLHDPVDDRHPDIGFLLADEPVSGLDKRRLFQAVLYLKYLQPQGIDPLRAPEMLDRIRAFSRQTKTANLKAALDLFLIEINKG